jgi:hypothetical protein
MTLHTRLALLVVSLVALCLSGCGGVADSRAIHEINLRVSRHGQALSGRQVSVAMRAYENVPFGQPRTTTTDAAGQAHTTFETMWGAAFVVIPPLGLIPPHPPKPVYAVTVADRQVVVSPDTPGVTYRWEHGSWHTDASVSVP